MKRLICCLDGTWNDDKTPETWTNVVRLHRAIPERDGRGVTQIARYIVGVGTGYDEQTGFVIGASGVEVGDRVKAGYTFLREHYEPGDEIYLFGFSRGAFAARSLASFIDKIGIASGAGAFSLDDAWSRYRDGGPSSGKAAASAARVTCLGVWDTVGNLGNPLISRSRISRRFAFHDMRLPATVGVALQALSIDEQRGPFRPALWTRPKDRTLPAGQQVEQVWFAGAHADVGGGYKETALSDIALLWMAERTAALTGLGIDIDTLRQTARPDPLGLQHSANTGRIFKWSGRVPFVRLIGQKRAGVSPLRRLLLGSWRTGKVPRGHVPVNEAIHESVKTRFGRQVIEDCDGRSRTIVYRPRNLSAALDK